MFRATWLHPRLSTLWWIIRKSLACSNCVSFTRRWPRLWLPPARHTQIWNSHNTLKKKGAVGVIVLALARTPHHRCINYCGQETEGGVGLFSGAWCKKKEGRMEKRRRERMSERETGVSSGSKLEIYCQCGSPFNLSVGGRH